MPFDIRFEAPTGQRIKSGQFRHMGKTVNCFIGIVPLKSWPNDYLYWSYYHRRWSKRIIAPCSSDAPCRSYKAFLRHLRRHESELIGRTVILQSRFLENNIIATWRPK